MKILFPIDDSRGSRATMAWATRFLDPKCAEIHLLHVIFWSVDALVREEEKANAQHLINQAERFFTERGFTVTQKEYRLGSPSDMICEYADENNIDQIIIGSHGHRAVGRVLMGNISRRVFQSAHQPVLLLNTKGQPTLEVSRPEDISLVSEPDYDIRVLLPVDGSSGSNRTLAWAAEFLDKEKSRIYLLNVYDFTPEGGIRHPEYSQSEAVLNAAQSFLEQAGFTVEAKAYVLGTPATAICAYADNHNIDQIIIGSHGKPGLQKFLMGSVTEEVFKTANQPVIVYNNTATPSLTIELPGQLNLAEGEC